MYVDRYQLKCNITDCNIYFRVKTSFHTIVNHRIDTYTGIPSARACSNVTSGSRTANEVPTKTITSASAIW